MRSESIMKNNFTFIFVNDLSINVWSSAIKSQSFPFVLGVAGDQFSSSNDFLKFKPSWIVLKVREFLLDDVVPIFYPKWFVLSVHYSIDEGSIHFLPLTIFWTYSLTNLTKELLLIIWGKYIAFMMGWGLGSPAHSHSLR